MDNQNNPLKTKVLELYLQLSDLSSTMETQIRCEYGSSYKTTFKAFKKSMYELHELSHRHLKTQPKKYNEWREHSKRTDKPFALWSIKVFESYVDELVNMRLIDIMKDVR